LGRHYLFQIGSKQYGIGLSVNVPNIPSFHYSNCERSDLSYLCDLYRGAA
jgi:hypothetical protein